MKSILLNLFSLLLILQVSCVKIGISPEDSFETNLKNTSSFVYLSSVERPTELYRYSIASSSGDQLTFTEGKVFDYSVNPKNGDIVISVLNLEGGSDIWFLSPPYMESQMIIPCAAETCSSAQFSSDGLTLTYQKGIFDYDSDFQVKNSNIRFFDLSNKTEVKKFGFPINNGVNPEWSPDGRYLAYIQTDPIGLKVLDLLGNEILFQNNVRQQNSFVWGEDSKILYYLTSELINDQLKIFLQEHWIQGGENNSIDIGLENDEIITGLNLSPDSKKLIFGVRFASLIPAQKMVIFDLISKRIIKELNDPTSSAGNYSWDHAGDLIIYQKFSFESEEQRPEIAIWDLEKNISFTTVKDAYSPSFLP